MLNRSRRNLALLGAGCVFALATACSGGQHPSAASSASPVAAVPVPSSTPDIVPAGDGIRLGSGWYAFQHFKGLAFRWADNDAEFTACPTAAHRTVSMLIQPGPGVGSRPFQMTVSGNQGDSLTTMVNGVKPVRIAIRKGATAETFVLHARSKNLPTPHDPRVLNYRALVIGIRSPITACRNGIRFDGSPIALDKNWYTLEHYQGQTFRWVNNDAQIVLTKAQPAPFTLEAEVAAGPSLAGAPLKIAVQSADGKTLAAQGPIVGRSYAAFHLPAQPKGTVLTLHVQSADAKVPHDPRTLNFRVFSLKIKP
uniref:Uncharacterized protein n=1 Tax=mine drainage metagenome TaxID=410659 RepID=E6Q5U0_9ZZZZ